MEASTLNGGHPAGEPPIRFHRYSGGLLLTFTLLLASQRPLAAESPQALQTNIEKSCSVIQAELRSCKCALNFLTSNIGPDNTAILLDVWTAGQGYAGDPTPAFREIYRKYDHAKVLAATNSFFQVRERFFGVCSPWGEMFYDN